MPLQETPLSSGALPPSPQNFTSPGDVKSINGNSKSPRISTKLDGKLQPLTSEVIPRVDGYFLEQWPFRTQHAHYLDTCSMDEAKSLYRQVPGLVLGDPNTKPASPVEKIISTLYGQIRATGKLAEEFCATTLEWFQLCTSKDRKQYKATSFKDYLDFRSVDCGYKMELAILSWSTNTHIPRELPVILALEKWAGYHLFLVNDVFSYRREVRRMQEGAALVNSVQVVMQERGLGEIEAQNWLQNYIVEVENEFEKVVEEYDGRQRAFVHQYAQYLREMMAGNLMWSMLCGRYHVRSRIHK
ncbi:isoprenoid synthase domain-containing protein [Kalaharituber pfeilii]|nr:isoprenoid synthase domain-containing protein [Kalaharituber pfeilii]